MNLCTGWELPFPICSHEQSARASWRGRDRKRMRIDVGRVIFCPGIRRLTLVQCLSIRGPVSRQRCAARRSRGQQPLADPRRSVERRIWLIIVRQFDIIIQVLDNDPSFWSTDSEVSTLLSLWTSELVGPSIDRLQSLMGKGDSSHNRVHSLRELEFQQIPFASSHLVKTGIPG